uniref:Uncharacterized protein n=1 Tax=Acrobeloides nanus TaxID=290746 RepID=A0A914E5R5_9BILA
MSKLAEVSLKLEHKRYFTNPFVGNPTELAKIVTDEWIKEKVDKLAKRLIEQEIKDEDCKKDDTTQWMIHLVGDANPLGDGLVNVGCYPVMFRVHK